MQRQLPSDMVLSVGYVGTHGLHLFGDEFRNYDHVPTATRLELRNHINDTVATPASLVSLYGPTAPLSLIDRPYPQYANLSVNSNPDGFNRYESLQVKLEKRYSSGFNFMLAYTHQKNIGTPNTGSIIGNTATPTTIGRTVGRSSLVAGAISGGSGNTAAGRPAGSGQPLSRYRADGGRHSQRAEHCRFLGAAFWKGKRFLSGSRFADAILGGWTWTQNWNFQNGVPLVINAPCNGIQGEIGVCRPNFIGNPNFSGSRSRADQENQWFNPAAFEPAFGSNPAILTAPDPSVFDAWWQFGNMGVRNPAVRSPGFWNTDMSLSKDFHISEKKYFSFRWDLYNALNHQNLGIPNTNWCLPPNANGSTDLIHQFGCQFGRITNVQTDPRAMQFGLKFYF